MPGDGQVGGEGAARRLDLEDVAGLEVVTSQPETAPPSTSRTPIRGGGPAGAQIE